jgi:hypothetical protein
MRWEARKFLADLERCRKLNRYGGFDIELLEKECLFGTAVIFLAIFTVSRLYFFSSEETGYSMLLSVSLAGILSPFMGFLLFFLGERIGKAMAEKISMKRESLIPEGISFERAELIESVLEVLESPKMKDRALASFMERPKNTGTVKRHIKERNLKRLRKAGNDEEKYEIICDIYRLPCLLEMSKKE